MTIVLTVKERTNLPLDLSPINPKALNGMKTNEIAEIVVYAGNKRVQLSSLFDIEIEGEKASALRIVGDVNNARKIGYKMDGGEILIEGNGGLYVGEGMKEGTIVVNGDAGSWAGSSMRGGSLKINGSAGDFIGASYRGAREGMKGGEIVIKGNIGCEAGGWMSGGLIQAKGSAGPFLGVHMCGGFIMAEGDCDGRAGAQMLAGRIAVLGKLTDMLPSFSIDGVRGQAELGAVKVDGPFYMFTGDNNENGKGRIYALKEQNPQLAWCEKYLGGWD